MTDIPTTTIEHCEPSQMKRLLSLAQGSGRHAEFLPSALSGREELARHLTTLCKDSAQAGDALLSVTCAQHTALAVLQEIKELAKSLATKAESEPERAAANLLYHAALAAALGRHGQSISSRSASARYALYEDLAGFLAGNPLGQVFCEAAEKLAPEALNAQSRSGKSA